MPKPIKVYITSDFLCSWCYLGVARLQTAVQSLRMETRLSLSSYLINSTPICPRKAWIAGLSHGIWLEALVVHGYAMAALGVGEGHDYNFPTITQAANTRLADRLTQLAQLKPRRRRGSSGGTVLAAIMVTFTQVLLG